MLLEEGLQYLYKECGWAVRFILITYLLDIPCLLLWPPHDRPARLRAHWFGSSTDFAPLAFFFDWLAFLVWIGGVQYITWRATPKGFYSSLSVFPWSTFFQTVGFGRFHSAALTALVVYYQYRQGCAERQKLLAQLLDPQTRANAARELSLDPAIEYYSSY